jgi:hypothetical protein
MIPCSPPPAPEEFPSIEATCGNSLMVKAQSFLDSQHISVNEIQSDHLAILNKIGEGLFGTIHFAELTTANQEKRSVLVKSLNDNADEKQK